MVQPSTKIEEPSTSTPVVNESDDDNGDQGSSQTESIPLNPPIPESSSKPSSTQWFLLMIFLTTNGRQDTKNLLLGSMYK